MKKKRMKKNKTKKKTKKWKEKKKRIRKQIKEINLIYMPILWKKMLFKNVEIHFLNKKENYEYLKIYLIAQAFLINSIMKHPL